MIAARGDEQDDGSGDALQLELDADEEQQEDGNGGGAHHVGAETEPAALDGAVLRFGSPPSSPSPAVVLGGEAPQVGAVLGRRLLGAIGLASPSKLPGAKMGLGVVLHLEGDQEQGDAHRRDTREQGLVLACAPIIDRPPSSASDAVSGFGDQDGVDDSFDSASLQDTARAVQDQEEEMVHKCSDANWSTTDEASALEGQVEEESTVGDISAERRATVDDTDAKGQQLVDQDTSDQCQQTDEDIDVEEELVLEEGLDDKWGPTHNALMVQYWVKQDECAANGDHIALEGQEKAAEQCTGGELGASMDDNAVGDQVMVDPEGAIGKQVATKDGITVEDQEKMVEQCTTDELGATDAVEDQEVAELGVITEMGATMDDNAVEDHEVVEQSVIDERHATTDGIAVEDQEKAVEQCAVNESRTTKDENAVEEKEVVVEQGVIGKQGAMPMDDIAVEDKEKAVEQYVSFELIANKDENAVEEHKKVAEQGVINKSGGTKDENYVEEQENVKEQGIIDKCDTANDGTALGVQKRAAELCIGDEQRAFKDVVAVHNQENMLEQSISDERGATKGEFTVERHKEVVEHVRHEWGATEDDLAVDTAASGGVSGISSSKVVSVTVNGSDGETVKKEKVKLCVGYPRRPGKLHCPFYMSTGCCSYGLSCHFNHPLLKAKSDVSSVPSEQGNHGVAEILELNRVGLPIREGARNCTYYMRNGTCRYGKKCHFNHPEQVIDAQFYPPTGWDDNVLTSSPHLKKSSDHATLHDTSYLKSSDDATLGDTSYSKKYSDLAILDDTSYSKKSSDHATLDDTSSSSEVLPPNILRMLLPPQKVPPSTEEKVMKVKKDPDWSSASDDSDGCCSADSTDGPLCKQEHVDYPKRPGRPECPFYMRFGDCKFASACKYHHSKDRFPSRYHSKDPSLGEELMEYPERPGQLECPFYMRSRFCKFGAECKFHHPKDLTPSRWSPTTTKKSVAATNEHHPATRVTLKHHICQQLHYPERPGQPDCRYYMQFGKCKYLSACIFHHPKDRLPSGWHPSDPAHSDQYDTWQPTTNRIDDLCQQTQVGPEIPGMPECPFYMKTGTCQFGSSCEFHHPKDRCSTTEEAVHQLTDLAYDNFTRSENVLQQQEQTMYPERPGEPECSYYMRHGSCKFQMNCKYHHPRDRLSKKQDHFVSTCYS